MITLIKVNVLFTVQCRVNKRPIALARPPKFSQHFHARIYYNSKIKSIQTLFQVTNRNRKLTLSPQKWYERFLHLHFVVCRVEHVVHRRRFQGVFKWSSCAWWNYDTKVKPIESQNSLLWDVDVNTCRDQQLRTICVPKLRISM